MHIRSILIKAKKKVKSVSSIIRVFMVFCFLFFFFVLFLLLKICTEGSLVSVPWWLKCETNVKHVKNVKHPAKHVKSHAWMRTIRKHVKSHALRREKMTFFFACRFFLKLKLIGLTQFDRLRNKKNYKILGPKIFFFSSCFRSSRQAILKSWQPCISTGQLIGLTTSLIPIHIIIR